MDSKDFLGLFGMLEMEAAAARIVTKGMDAWGYKKMPIVAEDFKTSHELAGFIELVYRGWMKHGKYNGEFYVTEDFIGRIEEKLGKMKKRLEGINYWRKGFSLCPDCGCGRFLKGPEGGNSINFKCANCGSKFNDLGPFGIERIGDAQGQANP